MKKLLMPYRQELLDELEKELKSELKTNYKDHIVLKQSSVSSDNETILELESPVYMSLQVVDTCKPKWQTYSNQLNGDLMQMRELLPSAFSSHLLYKQLTPPAASLMQASSSTQQTAAVP